ncbi:MAG: glycosyltransferase family 4 protein [Solirubrobacterales bacterium]
MRIGIDGRSAIWYMGTGIGTYAYQLIKALSIIDLKNNYLIFMPKDSKHPLHLSSNFELADICREKKTCFWDEVNIPNILKDNKMDLYHVPQNGVGLPKSKDCPSVITLHDVIPCRMPETVSYEYLKIFSEKIPEIIKLCSGIITVSNFSKMDIIKEFNYPEEKIKVTPLAAESRYHPIDKILSKYFISKKYSIKDKYILYVGGLGPRKNISGLIEAFSLIRHKHQIKLVIAGTKGKSYDTLKKLSYKLNIENDVVFPGFIQTRDLPFLYNGAELFVYPSFYEGFGLPPVEAMACGIPVISSNAASIPEIIGTGGILVNPRDTVELSHAMDNVLSDKALAEAMCLNGIVRSSNFNWESTAKKTLEFYSKISSNIY